MVNGLLDDNIFKTIERAWQRIPDFNKTYLKLNNLKFKDALLKQLQICYIFFEQNISKIFFNFEKLI